MPYSSARLVGTYSWCVRGAIYFFWVAFFVRRWFLYAVRRRRRRRRRCDGRAGPAQPLSGAARRLRSLRRPGGVGRSAGWHRAARWLLRVPPLRDGAHVARAGRRYRQPLPAPVGRRVRSAGPVRSFFFFWSTLHRAGRSRYYTLFACAATTK